MKIKELCKLSDFDVIFSVLKSKYQANENEKESYYIIFKIMENSKDMELEKIYVNVVNYETYADVYGEVKYSDNKIVLYYSKFYEWGNFYSPRYIKNIEEYIADILFEATYVSFDEEEIEMAFMKKMEI